MSMPYRAVLLAAMLTVSGGASAGTTFGEWKVEQSGKFFEAFTKNKSGSMIGVICEEASSNCIFYLAPGIDCEAGGAYAAFANMSSGSQVMKLGCQKLAGNPQNLFVFEDFDAIQKLVLEELAIGFALAMQDGMFKTVRFSLQGSNQALQAVADHFKSADEFRDEVK